MWWCLIDGRGSRRVHVHLGTVHGDLDARVLHALLVLVHLVHSSGPLIWSTHLVHSFGPLVWSTRLVHSFGPLLWSTRLVHSFGPLIWSIGTFIGPLIWSIHSSIHSSTPSTRSFIRSIDSRLDCEGTHVWFTRRSAIGWLVVRERNRRE